MKKRIKNKPTGKQLQALRQAAFERQVRLDTTNQIMLAVAQVLMAEHEFTPDQCVEFSQKVGEHIRQNNATLRGGTAAWVEEQTAVAEALEPEDTAVEEGDDE